MRAFPGLQPYFLVAKKQAKFMLELVDEITLLLSDSEEIKKSLGAINFYGLN
jgi:hypothetical protein